MAEANSGWRTARGQRERMETAALSNSSMTSPLSPPTSVELVNAPPPASGVGAPTTPLDICFVRVFSRRAGIDSLRKEVVWFQIAARSSTKFQWVVEKRYSECLQLYQRVSVLGLERDGHFLAPFPTKSGMFGSRGDAHLAQRQEGLDAFFASLLSTLQQLASTAIFQRDENGGDSLQAQRVAFSVLLGFLRVSSTSALVDVPKSIDKGTPIDFAMSVVSHNIALMQSPDRQSNKPENNESQIAIDAMGVSSDSHGGSSNNVVNVQTSSSADYPDPIQQQQGKGWLNSFNASFQNLAWGQHQQEGASGGTAPPFFVSSSQSAFIVIIMAPGIDPTDVDVNPSKGPQRAMTVSAAWPSITSLIGDGTVEGAELPIETDAQTLANTLPSGKFELSVKIPRWASEDDFSLVAANGCLHLRWEHQ